MYLTMENKRNYTYVAGDYVVYPTHGVGRIIGTENNHIEGSKISLNREDKPA